MTSTFKIDTNDINNFLDTLFTISEKKTSSSKCNKKDTSKMVCSLLGDTVNALYDIKNNNVVVQKNAEYHLCQRVYRTMLELNEEEKKKLKKKITEIILNI